MNPKKQPDDDLPEYLCQSGVDESAIPKKRKDRIAMCKKFNGVFRKEMTCKT